MLTEIIKQWVLFNTHINGHFVLVLCMCVCVRACTRVCVCVCVCVLRERKQGKERGNVYLSSCVKSAQFSILTAFLCQTCCIKTSVFLRSTSTLSLLGFILWWNTYFLFIKQILYPVILNRMVLSKTLHPIGFRALNIWT